MWAAGAFDEAPGRWGRDAWGKARVRRPPVLGAVRRHARLEGADTDLEAEEGAELRAELVHAAAREVAPRGHRHARARGDADGDADRLDWQVADQQVVHLRRRQGGRVTVCALAGRLAAPSSAAALPTLRCVCAPLPRSRWPPSSTRRAGPAPAPARPSRREPRPAWAPASERGGSEPCGSRVVSLGGVGGRPAPPTQLHTARSAGVRVRARARRTQLKTKMYIAPSKSADTVPTMMSERFCRTVRHALRSPTSAAAAASC